MAVLSETITIPIWTVAAAVAAIVIAIVLIGRLAAKRQVAAVVGIALLAAFALTVPAWLQASANRPGRHDVVAVSGDATAERRALETRRADLTARATLPGSPLACLDALAGEPVETACEHTVFANPLSVAVAVSYAGAQLRLLADGIAFARRADASYEASLVDLRLAAENDAYGIYAHVLATRDGCTHERCAAFALLRDVSTLKVHLRQRLYATYVAEHRERWGLPTRSLASAAPVPVPPDASATATTTEAPAATTAMAPPVSTPVAAVPTPLPKARPTTTVAARAVTETSAPAPVVAEAPPAAVAEVAPARTRGLIPPVSSVLPNIDFPSSSSIPAISIMAAEPKLPPAEAATAAPSTAPRRSSSQQ